MEHGESGYIAKDGCIRVMTGVRWRDGRKFVKYGESEKKKIAKDGCTRVLIGVGWRAGRNFV